VPDLRPAEPPSIVGRWRMIEEAPADGQGGFFQQERRVLELRADGTGRVQNWIELHEGSWRLDGDVLTLDQLSMTVEKLDAETLVLVENLPRIYLRDGPQRRVRNTYRRISESELGPVLGRAVRRSAPPAATFRAAWEYGQDKLPTMEISVRKHVGGAGRLELRGDGSAWGCFGIATRRHFSESEYSSRDGRHRSENEDRRRLIGFRGAWTEGKDPVIVTADTSWGDSCTRFPDAPSMGRVELECTLLASNERLPVDTLACRIVEGPLALQELAVNPADSERAGPYTLQVEPRGRLTPEPGRPWLLLGADPGLHVRSQDGSRDRSPTVEFAAKAVELVEADFRTAPGPAAAAR
jgi:hypothetical protein